jgi:hypothetical protein
VRLGPLVRRTARELRGYRKSRTGQPSYVPDLHASGGRLEYSRDSGQYVGLSARRHVVLHRRSAGRRRSGPSRVADCRQHAGRKVVELPRKAKGTSYVVGEASLRRKGLNQTWQQ